MAVIINKLITGSMGVANSAPAYHADTWYKYSGDTEWRTVSITGTISGKITRPTSQIPNVTNIVALEIGSEVTSIGDQAFQSCINLQSVTIPSGVTSIGEQAFIGCSNLTSMTIPDGVTNIGFAAFSNCSGLTSVTIPNSVTSIGEVAFSGCSGLTSMTIPDSVTSIGEWAFYYTNNMETITFENKTKSQVQAMPNYPWGADYIQGGVSSRPIGVVIPDIPTVIPDIPTGPTITFICSDGNIVLSKQASGGGAVN